MGFRFLCPISEVSSVNSNIFALSMEIFHDDRWFVIFSAYFLVLGRVRVVYTIEIRNQRRKRIPRKNLHIHYWPTGGEYENEFIFVCLLWKWTFPHAPILLSLSLLFSVYCWCCCCFGCCCCCRFYCCYRCCCWLLALLLLLLGGCRLFSGKWKVLLKMA